MFRLARCFAGAALASMLLVGCAPLLTPECPPLPSGQDQPRAVDCQDAAAVALERLGDHQGIIRTQVVLGDFRPLVGGATSDAHVVFTYRDGARVAVPLYLTDAGSLIADEPAAY
jgi:hypothetical protein